MNFELIVALLAATVHSGTPVLYATLGEMLSEKGGVLNLGVEGMMSVSAFAAFMVCLVTGSAWLGLLAGGVAGFLMAALHGFVTITCLGNQVVSGLALTILGGGLTEFMGTPYIGLNTSGFNVWAIPGLSSIPVLGPIFFKHNMLVYMSLSSCRWPVLVLFPAHEAGACTWPPPARNARRRRRPPGLKPIASALLRGRRAAVS